MGTSSKGTPYRQSPTLHPLKVVPTYLPLKGIIVFSFPPPISPNEVKKWDFPNRYIGRHVKRMKRTPLKFKVLLDIKKIQVKENLIWKRQRN